MHSKKLIALIMCVITLLSFFTVKIVYAQDEVDNLVDATFNIEFVSGTEFNIQVMMDAQKLTLDKTYTADEIKSASAEDMGVFKALLYQMLERQIDGTFNNPEKINFTRPTFDGSKFNDELSIRLNPSFFGLSDSVNISNLINGILDMSGLVNYTIDFHGEPGWNNTYLVNLGENYGFQQTTGSKSGSNIVWTLKNWDGKNPDKTGLIQLNKINPTSKKLDSENIFLEFELDSKNPKSTSLSSNILLNELDVRRYNNLPSFVSDLDYIPSDGIRLLIENGFFSWDDVYKKTVKPLEEKIKTTIENSPFNQTLNLIFSWDNQTTVNCPVPYEISNMNDEPSIKAILKDAQINLQICGISNRAFFGLINAGAESNISKDDLNFGEDLSSIGYDYNVTLYLPENVNLNGTNTFSWNENISDFGEVKSDAAPNYNEEEKNMVIDVEVKNVDLNIISLFTGETELKFELDSNQISNYNVTKIPAEFSLPEKISLNYLNSDAFRLCVEENIFTSKKINDFLERQNGIFESIMRGIFPGLDINANVNRGKFDESLIWDGNISQMDAQKPIIDSNSAHSSYPIHFDLSIFPPKFGITTQNLRFSGLQSFNVTYRIIFPNGISVEAGDSLNKASVGKLDDGRYYLEVPLNATESNLTDEVNCKMIPSMLFILGIFTPCIIALVILIILIIVIILLRKKRKGREIKEPKAKKDKDENEDTAGYESEEYYIPPPPGSN